MRIAMILPILLLAACQVSKDGNNDSVTVAYNQDVAENAVVDVGNTAENIAGDIGNDVERTADKIDNKVDGTGHNAADNAQANAH
jgi:hypothetical protein